ncbi:MAG: prepilin-type N-terminal cleavage/methylation domain-containing protein [Planctomycetaceae bacterium]|nr:prepilin-type N-terminal cleavage/methylation domain-containing protein [Planctomycetaceae bacterium]
MKTVSRHIDSRRSGFTLFELILVLGVMLLIAGIVWPRMLAFYQTAELKDHGRRVYDTVSAARLAAIDNGIPYQFFYEPNGRHYVMVPTEDTPPTGESEDAGVTLTLPARAGQVPEEFTFKTPEGEESGSVSISPKLLADVPEELNLTNVRWSLPIVFYPDGSGSDATFELEDDQAQYLSFAVRALTGTASLSSIERRQR